MSEVEERPAKRKRRSRWGSETAKVNTPGMPTSLPSTLPDDQKEIYVCQLRMDEVSRRLRLQDWRIPEDPRDRSPSPPPTYDSQGRRTNMREQRIRKKLEEEQQKLVVKLSKLNPSYKPPSDFKPMQLKVQEKIYVPVNKNPTVNFIGLLIGPRGNTLKKMEKESGAKIMIRGKGSIKEGKGQQSTNPADNDELHALVTGNSDEAVKKAVKLINNIIKAGIECPEGQNDLKRNQLRELAELNGTLRDDDNIRCSNCGSDAHRHWQCPEKKNITNTLICRKCGGAGHIARDCLQGPGSGANAVPDGRVGGESGPQGVGNTSKMDNEYLSFMQELGEAPSGGEGAPAAHLPPPPPPMSAGGQPAYSGVEYGYQPVYPNGGGYAQHPAGQGSQYGHLPPPPPPLQQGSNGDQQGWNQGYHH
eukprot:Nk52_evm1s2401 gene=Nk52_evmTU1s2401